MAGKYKQRCMLCNKLMYCTAETVRVQDDDVAGWQRIWGRRIQDTAVGGIMSALKQGAHTLIEIDRFVPTTKTCNECGNVQNISLNERIFNCERCGLKIDRNFNSTLCMKKTLQGVAKLLNPRAHYDL